MTKPRLTMNLASIRHRLVVAVLCASALVATAAPKTIALPPDGVQLKESALPGYRLAQSQCVACHSAEYMLYQPANAARPYWDAMAKRMKQVFKAPLNDDDIPVIVDYLVKTYGNEQPK